MIHWTGRFVTHLPPDPHGWWWHVFYDWQTLWAGGAALVAALIAVWLSRGQLHAARGQLAESKRQADLQRNGRLRAARASLPSQLSAICEYADILARRIAEATPRLAPALTEEASYAIDVVVRIKPLAFPPEAIRALERVLEYVANEPVAERIESILREVQVLSVRIEGLRNGEAVSLHYLASLILQTASIYARAESLFDFARRHSDTVSGDSLWERVHAALTFFGIELPAVRAIAKHEEAQGFPPGEADTRTIE